MMDWIKSSLKSKSPSLVLTIIAGCVLLSGLITIASVLFAQGHLKKVTIVSADANITLLIGLSFVYLSTLLKRGKHNAWLIAQPLYAYILIRNIRHFVFDIPSDIDNILPAFLNLLVPTIALYGLVFFRHLFNVRSETRNFMVALRRVILILIVTFMYGVIGFQLMDDHDFHQEIPLLTGAHYTVDQFGLTTSKQLNPYTKRGQLFLDSLGFISVGSLFYAALALFSPIRFRLAGRKEDIQTMDRLLKKYPASSEDFFKIWPPDKAYFFNSSRSAGLAYKVVGSTALVVADPAGRGYEYGDLLTRFAQFCRVNDWTPALIHTGPDNLVLYKKLGFEVQKIGNEAIIDLVNFTQNVATNKYFRHINKKFTSQKYSCEVLLAPHDHQTLSHLHRISNDWLKVPGRAERGFMLGYFNRGYLNQCDLMVVKNASGQIVAFINQLPASYNKHEANFDLLRHAQGSPGNINDFLLINFIDYLHQQGFKTLNMGLAPLSGLDENDQPGVLNSILGLVYTVGNRFYSFKGLQRFKAKYEPDWQGRYIIFTGGMPGFMRTMNALVRAMRLSSGWF